MYPMRTNKIHVFIVYLVIFITYFKPGTQYIRIHKDTVKYTQDTHDDGEYGVSGRIQKNTHQILVSSK